MKKAFKITSILCLLSTLFFACNQNNKEEIQLFKQATNNGFLANEGYIRCNNYVDAWLDHADPETGLIPKNLSKSKDFWNAQDAAADNYPFMVLTSAITDEPRLNGKMLEMLKTEIALTSRLGNLPDTWSFSKQGFLNEYIDTAAILFGASEYIKDGLLPLTEWMGQSPWSDRMIKILDDIWKYAPVKTLYGNIPSLNVELNGEMMQVLSRVYWMENDEKYLEWALRLADFYLLGGNHPTNDFELLRLRDHGCEVVSGLCELYVTVSYAKPEKKEQYAGPLYNMLNRILEVGTNEHGMFYDVINPKTGEVVNETVADNWGYTYNGIYSVYQVDSVQKFRDSVLKVLNSLNIYENFSWEGNSADGYADAIEGALNLYNRERIPLVAGWIDRQVQTMWAMQDSTTARGAARYKNSGIIEGWHGDGNFARTTVMYSLWKTLGITIHPWREDVVFGAVLNDGKIYLAIQSGKKWEGKVRFDQSRYKTIMNMPLDYPRINQFPEWFVVEENRTYKLQINHHGNVKQFSGMELIEGTDLVLNGDEKYQILIEELTD